MPKVSDNEAQTTQDRTQQADREIRPEYYKTGADGKQHWDRAWERYREAWFVLNITKYVERYRDKEGLKDLYKARTYLNKLISLEELEEAERDTK
jgi:hypothetical protein